MNNFNNSIFSHRFRAVNSLDLIFLTEKSALLGESMSALMAVFASPTYAW